MTESLTALSRALGKLKKDDVAEKARILLWLAPAARKLSARSAKAADLGNILRALRKDITSNVAGVKDDPALLATLAAALAATAPADADLSLARELVRRVRRSEVRVGSDTWIASSGAHRHAATALVALAELLLGEQGRAFFRVRTLARIEQSSGSLDRGTSAFAHLVAALLSQGPEPALLTVEIDGKLHKVALDGGRGRLAAAALSQPGKHRIRVEVPGGHAAVYVRAATEYGLPWELAPSRPGSLRTTIEGKTNARDERAALDPQLAPARVQRSRLRALRGDRADAQADAIAEGVRPAGQSGLAPRDRHAADRRNRRVDDLDRTMLAPLGRALLPTGLSLAIPAGFEGQVRPRSGWALKHGLTVLNSPGTIDSDYRGELQILLINLGAEPVRIQPGERIAQLVIAPVATAALCEVSELPATGRGAGGFGHTGRG